MTQFHNSPVFRSNSVNANELTPEYVFDGKPPQLPTFFTALNQQMYTPHSPDFSDSNCFATRETTPGRDTIAGLPNVVDTSFPLLPQDLELSKDANSEDLEQLLRLCEALTFQQQQSQDNQHPDAAEAQPLHIDPPRLPPRADATLLRRSSFDWGGERNYCYDPSESPSLSATHNNFRKASAFPSLSSPPGHTTPLASENRARLTLSNSPRSRAVLSCQGTPSLPESSFVSPLSRFCQFGGRPTSASCSTTTSITPPEPRRPPINKEQFEAVVMEFLTNVSLPLPNTTSNNTSQLSPSTPKITLAPSDSNVSSLPLSPHCKILMPPAATKLPRLSAATSPDRNHGVSIDDFIEGRETSFDSTMSLKFANATARLSPCSIQASPSSSVVNIDSDVANSDFSVQRPTDKKRFFVKILLAEEIVEVAFLTRAHELNILKEETQTEVELSPEDHFFPGTQKRPVAISGSAEAPVYEVVDFFLTLILQQAQSGSSGLTKAGSSGLAKARCAIAVPRIVIGSLIGKNGSYIQNVRMQTGAHVYVSPLFVRADEACSERLVTISSRDRCSLRVATFTITRKINEHMANSSCRSVMYHRKHVPSASDFVRGNSASSPEMTPSPTKTRFASCSFDIDVGGHVDLAGHHPHGVSRLEAASRRLTKQQLDRPRGAHSRRPANSFDCSRTTGAGSMDMFLGQQINEGTGGRNSN